MKHLFIFSVVTFSVMLIGVSCQKEITYPNDSSDPRKIRFSLFTDEDFSGENGNITFTLSIRKSTNQVLWDSVLSPMRIKDIPDFANKLVVEKLVPGNDNSTLKVGFLYSIENVGNSWYWEMSPAGENFKAVDFNFH